MTTKTDDQTTLYSIVNDLDANLMIEAGAGTGKTYALVSRVVALVKAGVRMQHIVAITFTDGGGGRTLGTYQVANGTVAGRPTP